MNMETVDVIFIVITIILYTSGVILTFYMRFSRAVILRRIRKSGRVIGMTPVLITLMRERQNPLQSPSGMPPPPPYEMPKPTAPLGPPPSYHQ